MDEQGSSNTKKRRVEEKEKEERYEEEGVGVVKEEGSEEALAKRGGGRDMCGVEGMQRYLVAVEYVGTCFAGFQKQNDFRTVQGCLEAAFVKFVGESVTSVSSSRTDAGVHALKNVCHVDVIRTSKRKPGEVLKPHDPEVVKKAVNHFLQRDATDMAVVGVRCVAPNFHARFNAKERTYLYRIISVDGIASVFERDRAWNVPENLNLSVMQEACEVLIGHHDFSSFRAAGCQANSPMRTLDELSVSEVPMWPHIPCVGPNSFHEKKNGTSTFLNQDGQVTDSLSPNKVHHMKTVQNTEPIVSTNENERQPFVLRTEPDSYTKKSHRCFVVTARARSFLYHQVRLMVGTLKAVGSGALTVHDVKEILEARSITKVPRMAPAWGLYLADVKYDFDE